MIPRLAFLLCLMFAMPAGAVEVVERSIAELRAAMAAGRASSAGITAAYLERIAAMDRRGPALHAVIATSPDALAQARASDARRRAGKLLGPLDGVPILIKDNIETRELPTTAGSLALVRNASGMDAPVVARLRAGGAVILGKTNLSEWANIRSNRSMSGWSAVGGLVRNPYVLDRSACGSSSGSGAAVAASFAAAALGTETDGSVVCPASATGLVGLKPTLGLLPGGRIVPISHSQDTPGPMARSVADAALLLDVMAEGGGTSAAGLRADALRGTRIAVLRPAMSPELGTRFDTALKVLAQAGAVLVPVERPKTEGLGDLEYLVLKTELKTDLPAYLATTPATVKVRTLDNVIAFNRANAAAEMPWFGQDTFEEAAATKGADDPAYRLARAASQRQAAAALEAVLAAAEASLIVAPSGGPAWLSDPVNGDQSDGPSASRLPAVSGWPHLTVPMGLVRGLPVGLSFIAPAGADGALLAAGFAFEQAARARVAPRYRATIAVE